MTTRTAAEIIAHCEIEVNTAERQLKKFEQRFAISPANAFEWVDASFAAAAQLDLNRRIISALTKEGTQATPASIEEWARDELRSKARHMSRSTSVGANTMAQCSICELQAFVDFLDGRMF
jgi:hypothetical protein